MVILGVDPGSHATGYGVIEAQGSRCRFLDAGTIRALRTDPLPKRLLTIHQALLEVIDQHKPDAVAVEDVFNARNARSSLILGQARGVALLAGAVRQIPVAEYAPREVKQALTGNGAATKEQLRFMVTRMLSLAKEPASLDASDGLGLAICHALRGATEQVFRRGSSA